MLEARCLSVIGIGDRFSLQPFYQVEKQADFRGAIIGSEPAQACEIVAIEREDMREAMKVGRLDLTAAIA